MHLRSRDGIELTAVTSTPVTVLMPVRNGASTVLLALQDLLAGMADGDEMLIVDDGSEDATARVLNTAAETDSRIRVVTTPGLGLVEALNLGLQEATHKWIARADCDDRYPHDRLVHQRAACRAGVTLVTGDYQLVAGGRVTGRIPCAIKDPFVLASLLHPQRVPHPGVMFDRDAVLSVGAYQREDFPAEDLALWLRLAGTGRFVGVPRICVSWTMATGSVTHGNQQAQRAITAHLLSKRFPVDLCLGISADDVTSELDSYRGSEFESMRRVLLARDLRALTGRGLAPAAYKACRTRIALNPVGSLAASWQLARGKRQRDRYRSLMKPSEEVG